MAVRRRCLQHRLRLVRHMQENAVQIIARFFRGDREARLVDDLDERSGGQFKTDRQITFRSEEHTSELKSLMRISYAVFCLKKKTPLTTLLQYRMRHLPHTTTHTHT